MRGSLRLCAAVLAVGLVCGASQASVIVYGTYSDHPIAGGSSLSDVRMSVDMEVAGGYALVTFKNVSVWPEDSASFKAIVIDTVDDDTGSSVLWNGAVLTSLPGVSYNLSTVGSLPGIDDTDSTLLISLKAKPPAPYRGLNPGESLQVRFGTSLADGSTVEDYLAFFGGGLDTAADSLGFHAISADTVSGQSMVGSYVPEPATMSILAAGACLMALRRNRRQVKVA